MTTYDTRKISEQVCAWWRGFISLDKLGWFTINWVYTKDAER